jgi:hypothetical protein
MTWTFLYFIECAIKQEVDYMVIQLQCGADKYYEETDGLSK